MKTVIQGLRMLVVLTVLTGILYPVAITVAAGVLFPYQANGSLITQQDRIIGSAQIGQEFVSASYFWSRPSSTGYNPLPSGGSNQSATSAELAAEVKERASKFRTASNLGADDVLPTEMLFASGSGLDPHISPASAAMQIDRVAAARGFSAEQKEKLIVLVGQLTERAQLGMLGQPRINVLLLNIALDGIE